MDVFAVLAEQAEYLDGLVACRSEPMREARVKLPDLAGTHRHVVVGEDQTELSGEHIQPLVTLMGAKFRLDWFRRDSTSTGGPRVRVIDGEVARLVVDGDRLTAVELTDGQVFERTVVFVRPGSLPHDDGLLAGLSCDLDEVGFPVVDASGRTSTAGVWDAGNVVDPRAQVVTSAGAGSVAAIAINADLVQDEVDQAVEERRETALAAG